MNDLLPAFALGACIGVLAGAPVSIFLALKLWANLIASAPRVKVIRQR